MKIRIRRVRSRWRPRYELEISGDDGVVVWSGRSRAPSSTLVDRAGLHTTDSWDWIHAADAAHANGSALWITDPYQHDR